MSTSEAGPDRIEQAAVEATACGQLLRIADALDAEADDLGRPAGKAWDHLTFLAEGEAVGFRRAAEFLRRPDVQDAMREAVRHLLTQAMEVKT